MMKLTQDGYFYELPDNVSKGDRDEPIIKRAMRLHQDGNELFAPRRKELVNILSSIEAASAVRDFDSDGITYIYSSLIRDIIENHLEKEDFLTWDLQSLEKRKVRNKSKTLKAFDDIAMAAARSFVQESLENAGFNNVFGKEKFGVLRERAIKGNTFVLVSAEEGSNPVKFKSLMIDNVKMRTSTTCWEDVLEKDKELLLTFNYDDYDDFRNEYKGNKIVEKLKWGMIPVDDNERGLNDGTENTDKRRKGQVALYINWSKKGEETAIWYAGSDATIFKEFSGKDFPFKDENGDATCPVFHYRFMDSAKGFWDNGIGDLFYQLKNVDEFNTNNKIVANITAAKEYHMITAPTEEVDNVQLTIMEMEEARQEGRTPFGVNRAGQDGEQIIGYQRIGGGAPALNASYSLDNFVENKTISAGFTLQDTGAEKGKTLGAFQLELEAANRKAREIGRKNAYEFKRMLQYFYQILITSVEENDDTPINLDEEDISVEGVSKQFFSGKNAPNFTRGMAVKTLKGFKPFFTVQPLSGAMPNPVLELAKLNSAFSVFAGTPADMEIRQKIGEKLGVNVKIEDMQPQQAPTQEVPNILEEQNV